MKTSPVGLKLIESFEGLYLRAYKDPVGIWTIGYGHTTAAGAPTVKAGMVITAEQADEILASDLEKVEADVSRLVKVPLSQNQFDALVSFTFNLGAGNLSKSTLLRKLNAKDYAGARAEFLRWDRAGGKVLKGLTRRRQAEAELFGKA